MKTPFWVVATLLLAACQRSAPPEVEAVESIARGTTHRTEPERNGVCTFEERPVSERPQNYVSANRDSNVIFYQPPGGPLWSHVEGDRALADLAPTDLVVAAREGRDDLWIRPAGRTVTLHVGPNRLGCQSD